MKTIIKSIKKTYKTKYPKISTKKERAITIITLLVITGTDCFAPS
ncbi:MAG: hypothetical protein ACI9E3_000319, partial [Flavobacteriales bacterium]